MFPFLRYLFVMLKLHMFRPTTTNQYKQPASKRAVFLCFLYFQQHYDSLLVYYVRVISTWKFTFCSPNGGGVPRTHCRINKFIPTNPYPYIYSSIHLSLCSSIYYILTSGSVCSFANILKYSY